MIKFMVSRSWFKRSLLSLKKKFFKLKIDWSIQKNLNQRRSVRRKGIKEVMEEGKESREKVSLKTKFRNKKLKKTNNLIWFIAQWRK